MDLETRRNIVANLKALQEDCKNLMNHISLTSCFDGLTRSRTLVITDKPATDYFHLILGSAHEGLVKAFDEPIATFEESLPKQSAPTFFTLPRRDGYKHMQDMEEDEFADVLGTDAELDVNDREDIPLEPIQEKLRAAFEKFSQAIEAAYTNTDEAYKDKPNFTTGRKSQSVKLFARKEELRTDFEGLRWRVNALTDEPRQENCCAPIMNCFNRLRVV